MYSHTICILYMHMYGFPGGSVHKETACTAWDPGSISGWERSVGEGNGKSLQYSCLENPIDRDRGLQFMGLQRVGHNWVHTHTHTHTLPRDPACAYTDTHPHYPGIQRVHTHTHTHTLPRDPACAYTHTHTHTLPRDPACPHIPHTHY